MKRRELDIRLSQHGRRALISLQRHYAAARPGEVLRIISGMGLRPSAGDYERGEAGCRMRATVDVRLAGDLASIASAEGVSLERYVESLIVKAHSLAFGQEATNQSSATMAMPSLAAALA